MSFLKYKIRKTFGYVQMSTCFSFLTNKQTLALGNEGYPKYLTDQSMLSKIFSQTYSFTLKSSTFRGAPLDLPQQIMCLHPTLRQHHQHLPHYIHHLTLWCFPPAAPIATSYVQHIPCPFSAHAQTISAGPPITTFVSKVGPELCLSLLLKFCF